MDLFSRHPRPSSHHLPHDPSIGEVEILLVTSFTCFFSFLFPCSQVDCPSTIAVVGGAVPSPKSQLANPLPSPRQPKEAAYSEDRRLAVKKSLSPLKPRHPSSDFL
jgi:hypothetical protein